MAFRKRDGGVRGEEEEEEEKHKEIVAAARVMMESEVMKEKRMRVTRDVCVKRYSATVRK